MAHQRSKRRTLCLDPVCGFPPTPSHASDPFPVTKEHWNKDGTLHRDGKTESTRSFQCHLPGEGPSRVLLAMCQPLSVRHHLRYLVGTLSSLADGWPGSHVCSEQHGSTSVSLKTQHSSS